MDHLVEHPRIGMIRYQKSWGKRIGITVKPDFVRVSVPQRETIMNAQKFVESKIDWIKKISSKMRIEKEIGETLPEIDREEAREILNQKLSELATKHDFDYGKVSIRRQRTRWGSCSSKGNISLNMNLLHLPDELIDYVLLHELTHTKVNDHSSRFWDALVKVCPSAKIDRKRLKGYGYCLV